MHWYAFHIFRNSRKVFLKKLADDGQQFYTPVKVTRTLDFNYQTLETRQVLFPSIVFVRTSPEYVESVRHDPFSSVAPYTLPGEKTAAVIDDREMDIFRMVLESGCVQIDVVDEKLAKGDKVRVLDGVFKGSEGYIVRIKGDHRFVVALHGIAAVATSYIPQKFLEKIK